MRFGIYLSRSDIKGMCLFAILLLLATALVFFYAHRMPDNAETAETDDLLKESRHFFDSTGTYKQAEAAGSHPSLFPFDPNTADSGTFARLGISPSIAGRIVRYRSKGGRFRKPSDLRRIYGFPEECYRQLSPYIRITAPQGSGTRQIAVTPHKVEKAPVPTCAVNTVEKFDHLVVLNANDIDSLTLIRIPGIGPYYAHRFLEYRKKLGGYADVNQLAEIPHFPKDCIEWFCTDRQAVRTISINHAPFKQLLAHPYLNYEQVRAIFGYRHKFGRIDHLQQLANLEVFTPYDFERLRPYLSFQ